MRKLKKGKKAKKAIQNPKISKNDERLSNTKEIKKESKKSLQKTNNDKKSKSELEEEGCKINSPSKKKSQVEKQLKIKKNIKKIKTNSSNQGQPKIVTKNEPLISEMDQNQCLTIRHSERKVNKINHLNYVICHSCRKVDISEYMPKCTKKNCTSYFCYRCIEKYENVPS